MWVDVLSMFAVGALAACVVFIVSRLLRRRSRQLPKWAMPAAIGASMILFTIWNEYTWYSRVTSALPESVVVLSSGERTMPWAPWTYAVPVTVRFVALNGQATTESASNPNLRRSELLLVERWQPTRVVPVGFDCAHHRRADLIGGASLLPDGTLQGSQWVTPPPNDPMLQTVCR